MTDVILDQGATWRRRWTYANSNLTPIDISGASARFQARAGDAEGAVVFNLDSLAKGGITIVGASGAVDVVVSDAISSAIDFASLPHGSCFELQGDGTMRSANGGKCVYAVELVLPSGDVIPMDSGKLIVVREVVR